MRRFDPRFVVALIGYAGCAHAAVVPPEFLDCVVALGVMVPATEAGQPPRSDLPSRLVWATEGTGFFYGHLIKDGPDPKQRAYET
jgi:hypothetical protein